ncbi:MAG: replication factor C small subunit [Thermoplasmata archaeon]
MDEIWVEKYRPKKLEDVAGHQAIVQRLLSYAKVKNLPHLMFAGPAGTGKTTCAIALARDLYGEENWKLNFQELNASDERGIQTVRTKIKDFARTATMGDVPFKIIFLDEADALTNDAQAALRRTMEKYSATCRFILSCNYSSRIIEPIQSRCALFRFRPISNEDMAAYIRKVAQQEKITISDGAVEALIHISRGDMRKAINSLQVAASIKTEIDEDTLYQATAHAKPEYIKELLTTSLKGNFLAAREKMDTLFLEYGLSGEDIIRQIHYAVFELRIEDRQMVELIDRIAETEYRMAEGANERIQLDGLLAQFCLLGKIEKIMQ